MNSTFLQKVIICAVAGFCAACLIQWGKVFVEGADDAFNAGYKKDASSLTGRPRAESRLPLFARAGNLQTAA